MSSYPISDITLPCKSVTALVNRQSKRRVKHELQRNVDRLIEVESYFLKILFKDIEETYTDLFEWFNSEYKRLCDQMEKEGKFKYTYPDLSYFENKYKPLEYAS